MPEPKKGPIESAPIIASCATAEKSTGFADFKKMSGSDSRPPSKHERGDTGIGPVSERRAGFMPSSQGPELSYFQTFPSTPQPGRSERTSRSWSNASPRNGSLSMRRLPSRSA